MLCLECVGCCMVLCGGVCYCLLFVDCCLLFGACCLLGVMFVGLCCLLLVFDLRWLLCVGWCLMLCDVWCFLTIVCCLLCDGV